MADFAFFCVGALFAAVTAETPGQHERGDEQKRHDHRHHDPNPPERLVRTAAGVAAAAKAVAQRGIIVSVYSITIVTFANLYSFIPIIKTIKEEN